MEHSARKRSKGVYIVLAAALVSLAVVAVGGVYYYNQSREAKEELHNTYMRAFHDMGDYLNDIDVSLKKTLLASDAGQMSSLSTQLYMQAEAAKACLAQMPVEDASFDNTSKFLSQVGDYANYLSRKVIDDDAVTEEEYQNLGDLSAYAEAVSEEFSNMESAIYEGRMQIESLSVASPFVVHAAENSDFADGMERVDSISQEYPSLIYDGPFSDHIQTAEPVALMGKQEISRHTAESVVRLFLGEERASRVAYEGDGGGVMETYLFTGDDNGRNISMEVTKEGGMVLWMLDSREVKEQRLSVEQAMAAGEVFLSQRGYASMKSSYYEVSDNVATINYAYYTDNTVMYPDLIKVKIALDNGEIVGFESEGYLMCHKEREIPTNIIDEATARQKAGDHLSVDSVSMAYIPLESQREVYCYELKGTLGKNNFLVYINAETGAEEKILMLVESENGILTI